MAKPTERVLAHLHERGKIATAIVQDIIGAHRKPSEMLGYLRRRGHVIETDLPRYATEWIYHGQEGGAARVERELPPRIGLQFNKQTPKESAMTSQTTPKGEIVTGYKITDKNMQCRGFQYELGKWYEHEGELKMCESGFHFCEHPSGVWTYYSEGRVFKCEAEIVIKSTTPGANRKHVARRIRLTEEIEVTGDGNTGDWNTGNRNTGDGNTGDWNTGNKNTGDWNTGDGNTGDWNTGNKNTGDWNTGDGNTGNGNTGNKNTGDWNTGDGNTGYRNTGNKNTGDWNTGDGNTGYRNTGYKNTGYRNTGHGNCGNCHSGCLNHGEAPFYLFDLPARREDTDMSLVRDLANLLAFDDTIDPEPFLGLPNATPERIKELHEAHKNAREMSR
jgi:hypothetical protein